MSAILLSSIVERVALVAIKEVDLVVDDLPKVIELHLLLDHHGLELGL